jgi:hypothetical protein
MPDPSVADSPSWRFRVVERAMVDPQQLIAHPDNWRAHPDHQRGAMHAAITEIGFLGEVYVSQRSGRILDGHLRVALALRDAVPLIPVGFVDCADDADELKILATYDPIAALAEKDAERFSSIVERADVTHQALRDVFDSMIGASGGEPASERDDADVDTSPVDVPAVWGVVIECENEHDQLALLEELDAQGYTCRALLS